METTVSTSKSRGNILLPLFSGALAAVALISFVFHISPKNVALALSEFAKHHYFLTSFVCFITSFGFLKFYMGEIELNGASVTSGEKKVSGRTKRRLKIMAQNFKRTIDPYRDEKESLFINKNELSALRFGNKEVLDDIGKRQKRRKDLQTALSLGNLFKQKVIICFKEHEHGLQKHTLATIWHVDDENVCLKGGTTIPVRSIYKVEL